MKVGDLVRRTDDLVRDSLGAGIIVKVDNTSSGDMPFYQVVWQRGTSDLIWYDGLELQVINESRRHS
ncbi:MAG: hypothetical protein VYC40_01735 [Pseudomonadota bacterium]|nr:hypothetical protein [Pseudomonadota bacterium]